MHRRKDRSCDARESRSCDTLVIALHYDNQSNAHRITRHRLPSKSPVYTFLILFHAENDHSRMFPIRRVISIKSNDEICLFIYFEIKN